MFCLDLALILSVTLGLCVLVGAVAGGYIACKKHKKLTRSVLGSFVFDLCFFFTSSFIGKYEQRCLQ